MSQRQNTNIYIVVDPTPSCCLYVCPPGCCVPYSVSPRKASTRAAQQHPRFAGESKSIAFRQTLQRREVHRSKHRSRHITPNTIHPILFTYSRVEGSQQPTNHHRHRCWWVDPKDPVIGIIAAQACFPTQTSLTRVTSWRNRRGNGTTSADDRPNRLQRRPTVSRACPTSTSRASGESRWGGQA